jgi:hypothetical protein
MGETGARVLIESAHDGGSADDGGSGFVVRRVGFAVGREPERRRCATDGRAGNTD